MSTRIPRRARSFFPLLFVLLGLLTPAAQAADPPWLGAWQEVSNPDCLMLIERNRCVLKNAGEEPVFGCSVIGPDGDIWFRSAENHAHFKAKMVGDRLQLSGADDGTYMRLAAVPARLQILPLTIPAAKPVAAAHIQAIQAEADKRVQEDQAVRTDPAQQGRMGAVDADNTAWLKTVLAETGWPDAGRFGQRTASTMFLFVQHSGDLPLMVGTLPCIERDLTARACDPQDFALLYDRVQLMTGRPQRYGSQIVSDGGKQVVYLLEDKAKVEAFRAAIGLFPLKAYLRMAQQQTGTRIGFMERIRFDD